MIVVLFIARLKRGTLVRPSNLVSDLEEALAQRSANAGAILNQITELFLQRVEQYSTEQMDLYDEILNELVARVEIAARVRLAQRLASLNSAPTKTIRSLALDDEIDVAEPILSQSSALTDDILAQCIATKGQKHLHAIATRKEISETISHDLIVNGDRIVLGTLACNPGAAISDRGFGMLVRKGADDDWLTECIGKRSDIPSHHLRELLSNASEIVRKRLTTAYPALRGIIEDILPPRASTIGTSLAPAIDYKAAEAIVSSLNLTETAVAEFAIGKRLGETIVSISRLSGLSVYEIERLILGRWTSPVAIILKAVGFQLRTVEAIYRARLAPGQGIEDDLIQTKAEFIAIRRPTAERIVRHFYAKRAVKFSNLGVRSSDQPPYTVKAVEDVGAGDGPA
jgi:uncharacterized protein (DUF2336 family)